MKLIKAITIILLLINFSDEYKFKSASLLEMQSSEDAKPADAAAGPVNKLSKAFIFPKVSGITLQQFLQLFIHTAFSLNKGEATQIFNFIDKKHTGEITESEWEDFVNLYIIPFETCDENNTHVLEKAEFEKCFNNEPSSKQIGVDEKTKDKNTDLLMDMLSFNSYDKKINFYSYLLLRQAMFSWGKCNSDKMHLSLSSFECAIGMTNHKGYISDKDLEEIYKAELLHLNSNEMTFPNYLKIVGVLSLFNILGARRDTFLLDKADFKKTLKEDKLIFDIPEREIDSFYDLIGQNSLDFKSFLFLYTNYRFFNLISKGESSVKVDELIKIFDDQSMPQKIKEDVDTSFTNFKKEEYSEHLQVRKTRTGEDKYFIFKEKNQEDKKEGAANQDNRKIFLTTHCSEHPCENIKRKEFIKAMAYASLFEVLSSKNHLNALPASLICQRFEESTEDNFISLRGIKRTGIDIICGMEGNVKIDILLFGTIMGLDNKLPGNKDLNSLDLKKIINEDIGMGEFPKEVLTDNTDEMTDKVKIGILTKAFTAHAMCAEDKRKAAKKPAEAKK
ncbi:MAG: hypothetical protein MJ252_16780 [archaeon]|nr:hypothetical protein [archaeon]